MRRNHWFSMAVALVGLVGCGPDASVTSEEREAAGVNNGVCKTTKFSSQGQLAARSSTSWSLTSQANLTAVVSTETTESVDAHGAKTQNVGTVCTTMNVPSHSFSLTTKASLKAVGMGDAEDATQDRLSLVLYRSVNGSLQWKRESTGVVAGLDASSLDDVSDNTDPIVGAPDDPNSYVGNGLVISDELEPGDYRLAVVYKRSPNSVNWWVDPALQARKYQAVTRIAYRFSVKSASQSCTDLNALNQYSCLTEACRREMAEDACLKTAGCAWDVASNDLSTGACFRKSGGGGGGTGFGDGAFIGEACTSESCATGLKCFTDDWGYPGGTCTQSCTGICPDKQGSATTFCIATVGLGGTCLARCDYTLHPGSGCRSGYSCAKDIERFGDSSVTQDVCFPNS